MKTLLPVVVFGDMPGKKLTMAAGRILIIFRHIVLEEYMQPN